MRTGSGFVDAQHAFVQARRAGRFARLAGALRRDHARRRLAVFERPPATATSRYGGVREIPLDAIDGTLEPSRAAQFDGAFRPVTDRARVRWQRIWLAEERGAVLPPISVVPVGCGCAYAVVDGHHRVSVARARGALAIDATIDAV
jgi:hypothetical protein